MEKNSVLSQIYNKKYVIKPRQPHKIKLKLILRY